MAVERAESSSRQWLVNRCIPLNPGIAFCYEGGIIRKQIGKGWIEQVRERRATAVMKQPCNRQNAQAAHALQSLVRPAPVRFIRPCGADHFPQDRVPDRPDTESRD